RSRLRRGARPRRGGARRDGRRDPAVPGGEPVTGRWSRCSKAVRHGELHHHLMKASGRTAVAAEFPTHLYVPAMRFPRISRAVPGCPLMPVTSRLLLTWADDFGFAALISDLPVESAAAVSHV